MTERMEVFGVDVTWPLLASEPRDRDVAIATLRALATDADKRGWVAWALEARLALLQLLRSAHDTAADALYSHLADDAGKHAFTWVRTRMG